MQRGRPGLSGPAADFTLDIENGVLEFHVNSSVEAEIGPLTIALEGGPAAAIELDAPRGYIYVEGGFEFHPVAFFGRVGLDLSGQIVFEPLHLIEDSCVDDIDLEQDGHVLVGVEADVPIPFARVMEQHCLPNPDKIVAAWRDMSAMQPA